MSPPHLAVQEEGVAWLKKKKKSTKAPDSLIGMGVSPEGDKVGGPGGGLWHWSTTGQMRGESWAALFTLVPSWAPPPVGPILLLDGRTGGLEFLMGPLSLAVLWPHARSVYGKGDWA